MSLPGLPSDCNDHPFYVAWINMKARCDNSLHPKYHYYGGRGIRYCTSWSKFDSFYSDMFSTWGPGLILDREDNNKGYDKENCRWVTNVESKRNRRYVTLNPEKVRHIRRLAAEGQYSIGTLARMFESTYHAVYNAIRRQTWTDVE